MSSDLRQAEERVRVADPIGLGEVDEAVEDEDVAEVDGGEDLNPLERRRSVEDDLLEAVLYESVV